MSWKNMLDHLPIWIANLLFVNFSKKKRSLLMICDNQSTSVLNLSIFIYRKIGKTSMAINV